MVKDIPVLVPVQETSALPYSSLLAYPNPKPESVKTRLRQLQELGVTHIEFAGPVRMEKLGVLGKGVAGMVVVGLMGGSRVAVKIRRTDSRRDALTREGEMLLRANDVGVGPKFLRGTPDVLAMGLIEGSTLPSWLMAVKGRGRKRRVKSLVRELLVQCHRLDSARLDHGELSRAHKNVLVAGGDVPWIVDFESASVRRRPSNVTSIAQYFFLGGRFAHRVGKVLGAFDRRELIGCLREYKLEEGFSGLESLLKVLRV